MLLSADKRNVTVKMPVTIETPSIIEFPLSLFVTGRAKPELIKVAFEELQQ